MTAPVQPEQPGQVCQKCGRPASGGEFDVSGLCQRCLNGPLPAASPTPAGRVVWGHGGATYRDEEVRNEPPAADSPTAGTWPLSDEGVPMCPCYGRTEVCDHAGGCPAITSAPVPDETQPDDERVHILKTWPVYFAALADGRKTYELRRDDRGFEVGDVLRLREWDPRMGTQFGPGGYTGREVQRVITHVLRDAPGFGLADGYALLSLAARPSADTETLRARLLKLADALEGRWRLYDGPDAAAALRAVLDGGR